AKPKDDTWARYEIAPPLEPPTVSLSRRNDEAVHRPSSPSNYARQLVSAEHPVERRRSNLPAPSAPTGCYPAGSHASVQRLVICPCATIRPPSRTVNVAPGTTLR